MYRRPGMAIYLYCVYVKLRRNIPTATRQLLTKGSICTTVPFLMSGGVYFIRLVTKSLNINFPF